MGRLLLWVAFGVMSAPMGSFGVVDYFPVTGDGSFNLYRNGGEGYTNTGIGSSYMVRLMKYNQHAGWMTFVGTVGDNTGLALSAFLAAYPQLQQATLYFRTDQPLPAPGSDPLGPCGAVIESIRSGNVGGLLEDQGTSSSYGPSAPAPAFQGSSQPVAFRACAVPTEGFVSQGDGIYVNRDPDPPGPDQGDPWIAPSGRILSGRNGFMFLGGDMIRYDIDNNGSDGLTGLFDGYQEDGIQTARFWALEDLLGLRQDILRPGFLPSAQAAYDAGQILVGGLASPTIVNLSQWVGTLDPRNENNDNTDANWYAVPIDAAFLADIANNPQHKGLTFITNTAMTTVNGTNVRFYAREGEGGIWAAYLAIAASETPEPPINDDCANAIVISSLPFTDTRDTTAATNPGTDPTNCGGVHPRSVWYRFTPAQSGPYRFSLCGSNYNTRLGIYAGSCGAFGSAIACSDDFCGLQSQVDVNLTAGTTYYVYSTVSGSAAGGAQVLNVTALPDFVVTSITLDPPSPLPDSLFSATVKVKNQGTVSGDAGRLDIYLDSPGAAACDQGGYAYADVGMLAAGESADFDFSGLPAGAGGRKTFRAFVDSTCDMAEFYEGNNQSTYSHRVWWVGYEDIFPAGADGSVNTYGAEGYAIQGDGQARMAKADQHFFFVGFGTVPGDDPPISDGPDATPDRLDGPVDDGLLLADWIVGKKIVTAKVYLRDYTHQFCDEWYPPGTYINDPVTILGFRVGNEGPFVDRGMNGSGYTGCCANYDNALLEGGENAAPAWRMGPPAPSGPKYSRRGAAGAGAEWYKLSTRDSNHPGQEVNAFRSFFDADGDGFGGYSGPINGTETSADDDMFAFEYIIRHSDAHSINSATMDAADCAGLDGGNEPRDAAYDGNLAGGWYGIPIDRVLAHALGADPECKGLVFSSIGVNSFLNTTFQGRDQNGWMWAPYLHITSTIAGDVNNDGCDDIFDVIDTITAFGSMPGDPLWNEEADFDCNLANDIFDVIDAITNFGQCR